MHWYFLVLILLSAEIYSKAAVIKNNNVHQLAKRADISASNQRQFQQDMLNAQNSYRKQHCVPAMAHSDDLSASALAYAEILASTNNFEHSDTDNGENLYWTTLSSGAKNVNANNATYAWYKELKDYNFAASQYSDATGHFTQLVWKDTNKVGCGYGVTSNGNKGYVVCHYSPPGNYEEDFRKNVFAKGSSC